VCNVGENSAQFLDENKEDFGLDSDTPLQKKLKNLEGHFTKIAIVLCLILFIEYVVCFFIGLGVSDNKAS
jgi:hypothetical protein